MGPQVAGVVSWMGGGWCRSRRDRRATCLAIRRLVNRSGRPLGDIDLAEINEVSAAHNIAVEKELELDRERARDNSVSLLGLAH